MAAERRPDGITLLAEASESEVAELAKYCAGRDLPLRRVGPGTPAMQAANGGPCVLLVGKGRGGHVSRQLHAWSGEIDLLISHDEAVFEQAEVMARTPRILAAPYDEGLLVEHLAHVAEAGDPDPFTAGMLELNIIGESPPLKRLLRTIAAVARYDAPVQIYGETGTGKELVARALHYASRRCDLPFIPVNCGALNDELLLAELFGYEKGAFTDAKQSRPGLISQAEGGTLMLDEVDSLSPKAQGALLRFLQEKEYRRLGSDEVCASDVRVIAATNRDLHRLVREGRFREDLFYRLHVVDLTVPPLRERPGDVEVLGRHFLDGLSRLYGEPDKRLHPITLRWMRDYSWPGNVRELENYLHRIFVMTDGPSICVPRTKGDPVQLATTPPPTSGDLAAFQEEKARVVARFEREYLMRIMREAGGNVSLAARRAGKERRAFARLLKKYGIDRDLIG